MRERLLLALARMIRRTLGSHSVDRFVHPRTESALTATIALYRFATPCRAFGLCIRAPKLLATSAVRQRTI